MTYFFADFYIHKAKERTSNIKTQKLKGKSKNHNLKSKTSYSLSFFIFKFCLVVLPFTFLLFT